MNRSEDKQEQHMAEHTPTTPSEAKAPTESVRAALQKLESSEAFAKAPKLRDFLSFVVNESLEGRGGQINATSIAQSVYERGPGFDGQSDPIVRVEAGRLRSRLMEYYGTDGAAETLVISIPKGGYAPHFEIREILTKPSAIVPQSAPRPKVPLRWLVAGGAALATVALAVFLSRQAPETASYSARFTENTEAYALFQEALIVGRPPHLDARVNAGLDLAKHAVALDPTFGGGYAAEGFLTWVNVVFGHSQDPEADAERSLALARKAIAVDPEFGWGYYSLSRALQLNGEPEEGVSAALHAVDIAPEIAEFHANYGLTLIGVGRYSEAIPPIEEAIRLSGDAVRAPYRNYLGIARYHAGDFDGAVRAIQENRERGGPDGPHMHAYLAAAHAGAGNQGKAQAVAELVKAETSGFPVGLFIGSLIPVTEDREALYASLGSLGIEISGI